MQVESLNFHAKSEELKQTIINNFAEMLNSLQINMQIYCKSEKYNINEYNTNDLYDFINNHINENNIVIKSLYIILSHNNLEILKMSVDTIRRYLKNINLYNKTVNINQYKEIKNISSNYILTDKYYRTYYVDNWPYSCEDGWLDFLYNCELDIDINSYIIPQDNSKSIKLLKKKLLDYGVNNDIELETSNDNNVFSNEIESIELMLDELRSNSGRMFLYSFYIIIKGDTIEQLNENSLLIKNLLNGKNIKIYPCLFYQQKANLNTKFNAKDKLNKYYNFTTNSLKTFFPFQINNICDKNGIYIGENLQNKSLIFLDIFLRDYAVILILGLMGSGKSFLTKNLIKNLSNNVEITILDRSGEYAIFKNEKNIKVYSKLSLYEYSVIMERYIQQVDKDYNNQKSIPRLFIVDELWAYINNNKYADKFNQLFNEIILEGRKKYLGICVISQLIESLLQTDIGISILKTANIKFLMKMGLNESKVISKQYYLNSQQQNFLVTANHEGLLMVDSNCVQFKVNTTKEREILYNTNPEVMQ